MKRTDVPARTRLTFDVPPGAENMTARMAADLVQNCELVGIAAGEGGTTITFEFVEKARVPEFEYVPERGRWVQIR